MATSSEKRALLFLASLAALGLGVRAVRSGGGGGDGTNPALDRQIAAVDSARARSRGERHNRADRKRSAPTSRRGRSDSLELSDLREEHAARGARPAPGGTDPLILAERKRRELSEANRASQERLDELTRVIAVTPKAEDGQPGPTRARARRPPVDLDTADEAAITSVPWIGPALAARIVTDRTQRGTFGSLEGLQRVAGIGPGLASRIAAHVRFSGSGMGPTKFIPLRKMRP